MQERITIACGIARLLGFACIAMGVLLAVPALALGCAASSVVSIIVISGVLDLHFAGQIVQRQRWAMQTVIGMSFLQALMFLAPVVVIILATTGNSRGSNESLGCCVMISCGAMVVLCIVAAIDAILALPAVPKLDTPQSGTHGFEPILPATPQTGESPTEPMPPVEGKDGST